MNKILSILTTVLLIGFVCYPNIFNELSPDIKKIEVQDIVDELTCEQETVNEFIKKSKIKEWLLPEIEKLNTKIREFQQKRKNDTLIVINDSLKYEAKKMYDNTVSRYSNSIK